MFQFMRKSDKDREKEKKPSVGGGGGGGGGGGKPEKVDKASLGKKVKDKLSPEDLHRLDEIRRSFKIGTKGKKEKPKLPSGIIADYSENFMSPLLNVTSPLRSPDDPETFPQLLPNSDSSESSLSSASVSLKEPAAGPAKPPRAPIAAGRTPPPVPSRKPPSTIRYSSDFSTSESHVGPAGLSRPPTSASSSSFTPSYITPPQSPSHKQLNLSKFYCVPELDLNERVLPAVSTKRGLLRTLVVERQPTGDFGFSLRRATVTLKDGSQETVLYAEPSQAKSKDIMDVFLLPGDRLVAVNSVPVESKGRDEVINLIRTSQYSVTLQVQTNPLWIENIERIRYQKEEDKTDGTASRRGVWIVHKNGFVSGLVLEKAEDTGKCKVKLDTGQVYEVDEDDIENTNPESLDNISQLWNLNLINESSILHILRNRFHSSLPFTLSTHRNILYLTRNANLDTENYKFLKQVVQPFSSSKLHPNLYSLALQSYRALVSSKRNQSIIIHGEAGNDTKRECVREILRHLSEGKGPHHNGNDAKLLSSVPNTNTNNPTGTFWDRLQAVEDLIQFFCASSESNHVKGTKLYNLEFDLGGRLVGINAQIFTLDMERMYDSPYFTVLQSLHDLSVCAVDVLGPYPNLKQLRKDLLLEEADTGSAVKASSPFFTSEISKSAAIEDNLQRIGRISEAMLLLGLGETFTKSVWSVFGAVYHLGHVIGVLHNNLVAAAATSSSSSGNKNETNNHHHQHTPQHHHHQQHNAGLLKHIEGGERHFKNACALLGLSTERVEKSLVSEDTEAARLRNVMGFAVGLYFESINSVFTTVNKNNSVGFRNIQCLSINVVQIGYSPSTPASFGDLSVNYINERLARLLKEINFDRLTKLYKSEGLETEVVTTPTSPTGKDALPVGNGTVFKDGSELTSYYEVLPLLDSFPGNVGAAGAGSNASQKKGKGLLFLIDEAKEPARFLEKFEAEFFGENDYRNTYWVDFRNTTISLCHANGTRIVEYDVKKVLSHADVVSASKFTNLLLQESQKDNINCMFLKSSSPIIGLCMSSNASEISLRRASSIRRNYATTWKKKNASLNIKIQADYLIEILERTQVQMLHCLNPSDSMSSTELDMASLRNQIRSVNLPDVIRFFKNGFPRYMVLQEFLRKFKCLGSSGLADEGLSVRDRVLDIFNRQDVPPNSYQLGNTMVFMKQWLLEELEQKRDDKLEPKIMALQSYCRGFLSRRQLEKMKVKDVAVRCVQKNVRKLLAVRNWSWWKLYQQISPLLKVQSSHEKLQSVLDELASLKIRLEKAEAERNRYKIENEKLEIKVNELTAELSDEQTTSAITSEKLDVEANEKQKLESQLSQLKSHCETLEQEKRQLELDLAYPVSEVNGDDNLDDYNDDFVYKQRWERVNRELEIQKQRLKQREQDHLDQIMVLKKSLEKKCNDAWEEAEEQRQVVAQLKRRIQKLSSELSDVRCLLQEETSRSALLEKKQRRFDTELANVQSQLDKERLKRESACRERDAAVMQRDSISNDLQGLKTELQMKESKIASLEAELEESSRFGGSNEQLNALRKAKHDLQIKVKEQEEELDDLAGQVQTLEAAKLRLDLQFEQMKKEHKREIQQREDELEDVRSSAHKKVKALECQLEAEHEERTTILRAKQEFERKFYDLEELSQQRSVSQEYASRLKRELKRTRALLKDAQTMLEQQKNDSSSKGLLRQLRHQLEDSEAQKARLNRAKQKLEEELSDALQQLEDMTKNRNEAENVKNSLLREKSQMQMQFEEYEEQLAEVMRKYKASVEQLSIEQNALTEQSMQIGELESANASLKETIAELNAKLESLEEDQVSQQIQKRFHMKIRELETRMELETTTKSRLEGQVSRLKEYIEKIQEDIKSAQTREYVALDKIKKLERQVREYKEETNRNAQKEMEAQSRRIMLEKQLDSSDLEIATLKNDLKLAMQRIEDLTVAIKECDEVSEDDEDEDSSTESVTSDTRISESFSHSQIPLDSETSKKSRSIAESYA